MAGAHANPTVWAGQPALTSGSTRLTLSCHDPTCPSVGARIRSTIMSASLTCERPLALDPPRPTLSDLGHLYQEESEHYRRGEPCDERAGIELFRRAIVDRDDNSWRELLAIHHDQMAMWCRFAVTSAPADVDEMIVVAWGRFWNSYTPDKLADAGGLAPILRYLKLCARSAAIDTVRRHAERRLDAGEFSTGGVYADACTAADPGPDLVISAEFWYVIRSHLHSEHERVLIDQRFRMGLTSRQIQAQRPDLFPTIGDVYGTKRNVLERLRRSRRLRAWLQ
jgi:hypothetical protein